MLSGCRNSLPSAMCLTAFAPGTTSPSIAVVKKILLPQTIGDECPRPSMGVFHLMFFAGFHSTGRFVSVETPEPSGPRHCGQFAAVAAPEIATNTTTAINAFTLPILFRLVFIRGAKRVQMRDRTHNYDAIRDRGRSHHDFTHRILREQLILRSSLDDENIAIFAGQINLSVRRDRRCRERGARAAETLLVDALAGLRVISSQHPLVRARVQQLAV